ncbi:MAG: TIGR03663 family protein [Verrucomicrobia bacterium]|nr:TIGR03663 family protein [Verrucomicrobiota bacterium]
MDSESAPTPASSDCLTRPERWIAWLIVALALFLRLLWLGMKPPHFDEGVNGWFVDQMTKQGYYPYDPSNYHGPFHFYVLFLAIKLFGRNVEALRLPLVLINTANVWLLLQFRRFIPWRVCAVAALAFAISPGMLFYSRYAIHEAWLVFGMTLAAWGAAEMWARGTARGLWAMAMGITLMLLNKETHLMHLAAFGLAAATLGGLEKLSPSSEDGLPRHPVAQQWNRKNFIDAVAVSLLLLIFFYSGGFLDPKPWDQLAANFFQAFALWSKTGVKGTDHVKEWYYWIQLFLRYEWPALLGLAWSARVLWPGMNRLTRYLAIYGCGALVAYSLVPYKTPWCIISIIWPFFFLFGSAVDSGVDFLEKRRYPAAGAWLPALAVLGASLAAACQLNYRQPTVPGEKTVPLPQCVLSHVMPKWEPFLALPTYVYVQTTNDYFKLTEPLGKLVALNPAAFHMPANILLSSYHPLPWTLGLFTNIGYYDKEKPPVMDAALIIAEENRVVELEAQLKESYFVCPFQLRDAMSGGKLYFNAERFAPVFPGRTPEFVPQGHRAP